MSDIAVEIATAYVSLVPSAKGIGQSIAKELAPIEGAAAATGARAGTGLGSKLTAGLKSALPSASGPAGALFSSTGALFGGALVVGFAAALVGIGQQFGSARRQIIQETGQTGKELAASFDTVKRVFGEVPASIGEVTTAVDLLQQRGVPLGASLDKLATQQLNLAHVTGTDVRANVEAATAVMAKYNVSLRDQPAALDAIFKASQASGKGITELLENMRTGGAALTQFGFSVEESAALLASLTKAGVNVTPALAGLRKAFGQLAKEGQDPKKALQDLIHEFDAGQDPAKAMADAIKLFGARSGVELATAIQQGKFSVGDLLKTITDGKGGINATAEATRTLGEKFEILKNQTILALEPLASAVWGELKVLIGDLIPPLTHVVTSIGQFAAAVAPLAAVFGAVLLGAFEAALPLLETFATGLDAITSFLGNFSAPVLIAAGAVGVLAFAFVALGGATGIAVAALELFDAAMALSSNPIFIAAAALTALGAVIKIFGSGQDLAAQEAKQLTAAMFETADGAGLFKSGISGAADGLKKFLVAQDAAGKLGALDKAIEGTGVSLNDVAKAVAGTSQQFETLKAGLVDTSGFTDQQRAALNAGKGIAEANRAYNGLTSSQQRAVDAVRGTIGAIDQQRDAFVKSAQAQLDFQARSGQLTPELRAQAESIANASVGTRGYGAALDFANQAIDAKIKKEDAAQLKTVAATQAGKDFRAEILSGAITTDDAASAASRFGLSLESAKDTIKTTNEELKAFVDAGLSGLPTTADAVTQWAGTVNTAFQGVADSAGKPASEVKKAQDALNKATDPSVIVANMRAQAKAIADFSFNIQALVSGGFLEAARQLLANPDKQAAGLLAQSLVNKPAIAKAFNDASGALTAGTAQFKAQLEGPLAQQLLVSSAFAAAGMSAGFSQNLNLTDPTAAQAAGATNALTAATPALVQSAQTMSSEAFNAYVNSLGLGKATQAQTDAIQATLRAGVAPAGANAAGIGAGATGGFGGALGLPGQAAGNLSATNSVFTGQARVDIANSARNAGRLVGVAFGQGVRQGIDGEIASVAAHAREMVDAAVIAARQRAGIRSPSQVTREMGRAIVRGFVLGMTETAAQAGDAAAKVVGQTVDAFATGRVHSSVGAGVRSPALSAAAVQAPRVVQLTVNSLDPRGSIPIILQALETHERKNGFVPIRTGKR